MARISAADAIPLFNKEIIKSEHKFKLMSARLRIVGIHMSIIPVRKTFLEWVKFFR